MPQDFILPLQNILLTLFCFSQINGSIIILTVNVTVFTGLKLRPLVILMSYVIFIAGRDSKLRKNAARAVFIVTDNSHIGPAGTSPIAAAERLRKMNVPIFSVGIGTAVNRSDITGVTGRKDHDFIINDLSTVPLKDFSQQIVAATCGKIREFFLC